MTERSAELMRVLLDAATAQNRGDITTEQYEIITGGWSHVITGPRAPSTLGGDEHVLARDAARYRKLRPHLTVDHGRDGGAGREVHLRLGFYRALEHWGPLGTVLTADEIIDLAPDEPPTITELP